MNLTHIFGPHTRPDPITWLMTPEGKKHIDEVFTPADTNLNAQTASDHKFGRCVWMAMQILTRRVDRRMFLEVIDKSVEQYEVREYLATLSKPLTWNPEYEID